MSYYVTSENSVLNINNAHLKVSGNIQTDVMKLGAIEFAPPASDVPGTVNFTNVTTGVTTTSNLNVGGTLQLGTVEVVATTHTLENTTALGNVTSNTVQFTNATTSLVASGNVVVTGNVTADHFVGDGSNITGISSTLQAITDSGNVTSNTVQFSNAITGFVTTANVEVGGELTVTGNVGVGTVSPGQNLHVHEAGSGQVVIAVTNDTTGGGNNDGIHFGLDASENGFIWHKQNTELQFATNNTKRVHITGSGLVHHANSQKYNFHWNPSLWGHSTNVSGNDTNIWDFVLNVPYDGWIFVKCNAHWARYNSLNNAHNGGNTSFYAWISVANRTADNSSNFDSHTGVSDGSYDRFHSYQSPDTGGAGSWRDFNYSNFYKVSAGNNTISLRVENHFGGGDYLNINGGAVSGFYIPKNYL